MDFFKEKMNVKEGGKPSAREAAKHGMHDTPKQPGKEAAKPLPKETRFITLHVVSQTYSPLKIKMGSNWHLRKLMKRYCAVRVYILIPYFNETY